MSLTRTSMSLKYHILIENKCILFLIKWCFNKLNCQLSEANRSGNIDKRALRKPGIIVNYLLGLARDLCMNKIVSSLDSSFATFFFFSLLFYLQLRGQIYYVSTISSIPTAIQYTFCFIEKFLRGFFF